MTVTTLAMLMNNEPVGVLSMGSGGEVQFQYEPSWVEQDERPISLSMPVRLEPYKGQVPYNFIDNLLPDAQDIRSKLQQRFETDTSRPFDLLSAIGRDCVGAIQLIPASEGNVGGLSIVGKELDEASLAQVLRDNGSLTNYGAHAHEDAFRISIAGAQFKTGLLYVDGRWYVPEGTTPTTHIIKLPMGNLTFAKIGDVDFSSSVENEWLCLLLAREMGLPAADAFIIHAEDERALAVERFDRMPSSNGSWLMRLPQEDMCQAFGKAPAQKYESDGGPGVKEIMGLLENAYDSDDRLLFFDYLLFNWLIANPDAHAKNYSIKLEKEGRYRLCPLYDVISVHPALAKQGGLQKQAVEMAMRMKGKNSHYRWDKIMPRHFVSAAEDAGINKFPFDRIKATLDGVESAIDRAQEQLPKGFPAEVADPIFKGVTGQAERFSIFMKDAFK